APRRVLDTAVERYDPAAQEIGPRRVLGVVGLPPPAAIGDLPRATADARVSALMYRPALDRVQALERGARRELAARHGLVKRRPHLGPQQRRSEEIVIGKTVEA